MSKFIVGVTLDPMYARRFLGTFSGFLAIGESRPLRAQAVAAPSGGAEFDRGGSDHNQIDVGRRR